LRSKSKGDGHGLLKIKVTEKLKYAVEILQKNFL
jgi:hypothetical protein